MRSGRVRLPHEDTDQQYHEGDEHEECDSVQGGSTDRSDIHMQPWERPLIIVGTETRMVS